MFLLKKVFQFRDHAAAQGGDEKPFLDHLEDLRIVVTRVLLTVVIATLICFSVQGWVMDVLRRPVTEVSITKISETLPERLGSEDKIDAEKWMEARKKARAGRGLTDGQRELYLKKLGDDELAFFARCILIAEATAALPEDQREPFITELGEISEEVRGQTLALLEKDPDLKFNKITDLRMMSSLRPTEAFMLSIKISFFAGLVISFPLLLYFILQFVLPGLKENEKKAFFPAMAIGFVLFLSGVLFAYFFVLPKVLVFFFDHGSQLGISNDWRIGYYISFATQFVLLFGLSFELPVIVMTLVKLGILNYPMMARTRSYAILAIFFAAAILTPTPDPGTMFLMATPMLILYEICIWMAYFNHKKEVKREQQEEAEYQAYLERRAAKERKRRENGDDDTDDDEPEPPRPTRPVEPRPPSSGITPINPEAIDPHLGDEPSDEAFDFHAEDHEGMDHGEVEDEDDSWDPHENEDWEHPTEDKYHDSTEFEISEEEAAELRGDEDAVHDKKEKKSRSDDDESKK